MSATRPRLCPISLAHLVGLGLFQAAVVLLFIEPWLAPAPLILFALLLAAGPFFPSWRFFLPVVRRGRRDCGALTLTFDDGPDPTATPLLLDLLDQHRVKVAFFLVGERALKYPALVREILQRGHEVGNHSQEHDVLLMLRSTERLSRSVARCQEAMAGFGVRPLAFRPPAWITNPRLWRVLLAQGLFCLAGSFRGFDQKARPEGLAARVLRRAQAGDILTFHDGRTGLGGSVESWLREIEAILAGLKARGLAVAPLSRVLGRPVMEPLDSGQPAGPVRSFYDGLAGSYDADQERASQSVLRRAEAQAVLLKLSQLLDGRQRVLELGAGTGRFTLELARRARSVLAVDLSPAMLERLRRKTAEAGLSNVETQAADLGGLSVEGPFDLICSFSTFEYADDFPAVLSKLSRLLTPEGRCYFTTAHRHPLRFFAQLGNAMRQGVWLSSRSLGEVRRAVTTAGLEVERLESQGLRLPLFGGMLIEAVARGPVSRPASS